MFGEAMGSVLGGVLSLVGGQRANEANLQNSRETDARSQANAREQMAFQERMSNSTHQRQVSDLKAAGLNPLLSATGGASAPAGAQGSTTLARAENTLTPAITSAMEAKRLGQEMKMQDETINLTKAQAAKAAMETTVMSKEVPKADVVNRMYKFLSPFLDKLERSGQSNIIKPMLQPRDNTNLNNYNKGMKSLKLKKD